MSSEPLFSDHWHRVRALRLSLAPDVQIRRHRYRGEPWYVLYRATSGACFRIRSAEFEFISRLDGSESVETLWQRAVAARDAAAPTQHELIALIAQLHEADLLDVDRRLSVDRLFARRTRAARADLRSRLLNPLYLRFALVDPDRLLARLGGWGRLLFGRGGAVLAVLLALLTLLQVAPLWPQLRHELATFDYFAPATALGFVLVFPVIKLLHELAHGLAVKRFGGEVHEMGVALLVLLPVPYVDASAAAAFPQRGQRMLVGAAGILLELGLAAVAALVWAHSEPGRVHDLALLVMLIGSVSTVLFNGNPLLKFDGYYVLADALEIPNLAERSRRYVLGGLQRLLTGSDEAAVVVPADRREAVWLASYAVLSACYRTVLMLAIAWMLAGRFFFVGVVLAGWVLANQAALPLWRGINHLAQLPMAPRLRAMAVALPVLLGSTAAAAWLPLPLNTLADGVVWLPEQALVRPAVPCEVRSVQVAVGTRVSPGDVLFVCRSDDVAAELAVLEARLDELTAERAGLDVVDRTRRQALERDIDVLERRRQHALAQRGDLQVRAEAAGRFVPTGDHALSGRHLAQGEVAAFVVPERERTVRVALRQADMGYLSRGVEQVQVRLDQYRHGDTVFTSRIVRQTPQSVDAVPSAALTTSGGGALPVDPTDSSGRTPLEPVFDLQLDWPEQAPAVPVGGRVRVKFRHPLAPLAEQLGTAARRTFLERLTL